MYKLCGAKTGKAVEVSSGLRKRSDAHHLNKTNRE